MKTKYKGPEKRKYLRLTTVQAVNYVRLSKDLKPIDRVIKRTILKDISSGGLRFVSREKIHIGMFLEVQLRIPGINIPITGIAKVLRVNYKSEKKTYEAGLSVIWTSQQYTDLIDKYVRKKKLEKIEKQLSKEY